MHYDDRGGVRHRGRRILSPYTAGYAAAMARAGRDLERLNTELQAELAKVCADLRELQAVVLARHGVVQELAGCIANGKLHWPAPLGAIRRCRCSESGGLLRMRNN
jgi:hypothetical protein